jgi:hypothetical protein
MAIEDLYYGDASLSKRVYCAWASVTGTVIYSTAAGTGGPLLWNDAQDIVCRILGISYAFTTLSGTASTLGLTGAGGQTAAPGSTTAIETTANLYIGGPASRAKVYRVGTPTNAGTFFLPLAQVTTAATSVPGGGGIVLLQRLVTVPPNCWVSIAASATLASGVAQMGLIWEEIAVDK